MTIAIWTKNFLRSTGLVDRDVATQSRVADSAGVKPVGRKMDASALRQMQTLQQAVPTGYTVLYRQRLTEVVQFDEAVADFETVIRLDRRSVDFIVLDHEGTPKLAILRDNGQARNQRVQWRFDEASELLKKSGLGVMRVADDQCITVDDLWSELRDKPARRPIAPAVSSFAPQPVALDGRQPLAV